MMANHVEIVEQPAGKSFRFRYESEGRCSGSILGENSTHRNPSYPKIKVHNYTGPIQVIISCVTNEKSHTSKFRQHPHKLSTKTSVSNNGTYSRPFNSCPSIIEFKDIGIVFVKKENIYNSLSVRKQNEIDPTGGGWDHINKPQLIDLHCVRLCFQVYGRDPNSNILGKNLGYAVSNKIVDKKSHGLLNIVELSTTMSQAQGGDKILIFCDRVKREDISIIFYEEEQTVDGPRRIWERELNYKNCKSLLIHHQYGIKFTTPSYKDPNIKEARHTFIQLHRPSDNEYSAPIQFEFIPNDQTTKSIHLINGKRRKCKKMNEKVAPLLNAIADQAKKNDAKSKSQKYKSNGIHLAEMNRNNDVHPAADVQPLIVFDQDDAYHGKENTFGSYQTQNQKNNVEEIMKEYFAPTFYYPPPNGHYDNLTNAPATCDTHTPYMQTNTYPEHHQQHQQHQQQLHTVNSYANEYAAGFQNMPADTNDMPLVYNNFNNFNIPPNHQDHSPANYTSQMDTNFYPPNSSDSLNRLNTAELFDASIININTYTTDGLLANNAETQLSI